MTRSSFWISAVPRLLLGLLLLVLPLGGMACGDGDDEPSEPGVTLKSIAISPATANIAVGATQQFAVNGVYSDGKTKPVKTGVTWTSSSTTVATINTAGLATAVGDGTTTITAAVGKLKATRSPACKSRRLPLRSGSARRSNMRPRPTTTTARPVM